RTSPPHPHPYQYQLAPYRTGVQDSMPCQSVRPSLARLPLRRLKASITSTTPPHDQATCVDYVDDRPSARWIDQSRGRPASHTSTGVRSLQSALRRPVRVYCVPEPEKHMYPNQNQTAPHARRFIASPKLNPTKYP
ncbi:unnamed protein product, partial [Ectocarpus sp. 12 AP-2014]